MDPDHQPRQTIFILGILRRSGTNFTCDLLVRHRDCQRVRPIAEDFLLAHADALTGFVERCTGSWSPKWDPDGAAASRLRDALGAACTEFLAAETRALVPDLPPFLVSKSPSVANLPLFPIFARSKALVIVRDGRSVAESGARSFGWSLEKVAHDWSRAAATILEAQELGTPFLLVRYERLVQDVRSELRRIFDYVGLDAASYNFEAAESLPVRGSSSFGAEDGVHWDRRVEKTSNFDPLHRWSNWTPDQHRMFNDIAGDRMQALGYEVADV